MSKQLQWIAVDWGTSNLRAYGLDDQNQVLLQGQSGQGMASLAPDEFEAALLNIIQEWLPGNGAVQVLACGMVGAKQGWREAPYRAVPCSPVSSTELTSVRTNDSRLDLKIVGGLSQGSPCDVMRGEETQLLGLLAGTDQCSETVCLPGTHSKWVTLQAQQVQRFQTFMTGEFYALLSQQSVLRHSVDQRLWSDEAFVQAVVEASERPQDLLSASFGIRARSLLVGDDAGVCAARLSGWLIGCELASASDFWQGQCVALVGAERLCALYAKALQTLGVQSSMHLPEQLTLAGLQLIRQQYLSSHSGASSE